MTPATGLTRTKHRIGGYRVIAPIGAGGFATVYRALNETTKSEVAIKVLAENHSLVPDTRRRFVDEVGLLSTIDSPSVAKIYEVGETDTGQPYMVLELADRGDLRRRLEEIRRKHQVLNRSDLIMLAHHLYDALTTLHQAEIVHRDVSPGNILIRSRRQGGRRAARGDGSVTLLEPGERFLLADLGHAKDLILASGFTAGGGTRGYASPEQRDDVTVVDHRADIFSATAVMEWAAHDGQYATDLEPFFDVGLAAEPDDRFESMEEWHAAFSAALGATAERSGRRVLLFRRLKTSVETLSERVSVRSLAVVAALVAVAGFAAIALNSAFNGSTTVAGNSAELSAETLGEGGIPTTEFDEPGLLRVKGNDEPFEVPPNGPGEDDPSGADTTTPDQATGPSVTTHLGGSGGQETTTSAGPETTISETTNATPGTGPAPTTGNGSGTTAEYENSPLATISAPIQGETISGDLEVTGTATFAGGVSKVRVVVRNEDTTTFWNPNTGGFQQQWRTFDVEVTGDDNTEVTWRFTVPAEDLTSGEYLIRAWARGSQGEGDSRGDAKVVVVP